MQRARRKLSDSLPSLRNLGGRPTNTRIPAQTAPASVQTNGSSDADEDWKVPQEDSNTTESAELIEEPHGEMNPLDATLKLPEIQQTTALFRELTKVQREFDIPIAIPIYVLVGGQSAGKSTVINMLLKFPATFASDGTATMCPVMYYIEQSEHRNDEIQVWVGAEYNRLEKLGSWRELYGRVDTHMARLRDGPGFSEDPLVVRVVSPRVFNFAVLDLPGMIQTDDEDSRAIDTMIENALTQPLKAFGRRDEMPGMAYQAIPIVISKFASPREDVTLKKIDELMERGGRRDWRKEKTSIVVCNKMDRNLNFPSVKKWLDLMETIEQNIEPIEPICTNLCPPLENGPAPDVARLRPQAYQEFLEKAQRLEQRWINRKVTEFCNLTGNAMEQSKLRQYEKDNFGFNILFRRVTMTMKRVVETNLPRVEDVLAAKASEFETKLDRLDERIDSHEASFYRDQHQDVLRDFLACIHTMLRKGDVNLTDECAVSFDDEKTEIQQRLLAADRRLKKEGKERKFDKFLKKFELTKAELKRLYGMVELGNEVEDLDEELAGVAQFDRLYTAWKAMVSVMEPPELTRAQLRAMKSGHTNSLKSDFVGQLRNVLDSKLEYIKLSCIYLCEVMKHFFEHVADRVYGLLIGKYRGDVLDDEKIAIDDAYADDLDEDLSVKFLRSIRDDYKRVMGRVIDEHLLSYIEDSKFALVNPNMPEFLLLLAHDIRRVKDKQTLQFQRFVRDSVPVIQENALEEYNPQLVDQTLIDEDNKAHEQQDITDDEDMTATEVHPVLDAVGNIADTAFALVGPFGGNLPIGSMVAKGINQVWKSSQESMQKTREEINRKLGWNKEDVSWRAEHLLKAAMSKTVIWDIHDNEQHVEAVVQTHIQIQQFLLMQDIETRVQRVMEVANQSDRDQFLEKALSKGLEEVDVGSAVRTLMREVGHMRATNKYALQRELAAVLKKHCAEDSKRIGRMSDAEVLAKYCDEDQERLKQEREVLNERFEAFQEMREGILAKIRDIRRGTGYGY